MIKDRIIEIKDRITHVPWWWLSGPSAHQVCCLWGRTLSAVWWPRQWLEQRSVGSDPDRRKGFQQTSPESLASLSGQAKKTELRLLRNKIHLKITWMDAAQEVCREVYHSCSMWKRHAASARQSPCPVGWAPGSQAEWRSHGWPQGHDHQSCNSTHPGCKNLNKTSWIIYRGRTKQCDT